MSSGPINLWQIEGENVETMTDFIFLGSKITVDGDCNHKIKTLAPRKESYDKPRQHIKKQRHHFADKGLYLFAKSCLTLATPWIVACQAPLPMGFSRQEY